MALRDLIRKYDRDFMPLLSGSSDSNVTLENIKREVISGKSSTNKKSHPITKKRMGGNKPHKKQRGNYSWSK